MTANLNINLKLQGIQSLTSFLFNKFEVVVCNDSWILIGHIHVQPKQPSGKCVHGTMYVKAKLL